MIDYLMGVSGNIQVFCWVAIGIIAFYTIVFIVTLIGVDNQVIENRIHEFKLLNTWCVVLLIICTLLLIFLP